MIPILDAATWYLNYDEWGNKDYTEWNTVMDFSLYTSIAAVFTGYHTHVGATNRFFKLNWLIRMAGWAESGYMLYLL